MQIENPCDVFFVCKSLFCVFRGRGVGGRARLSVFNILFFIFEINLGSLDATVPAVAVSVGVGDSQAPRPPGCSTLTSLTSVCVFGTTPCVHTRGHMCTPVPVQTPGHAQTQLCTSMHPYLQLCTSMHTQPCGRAHSRAEVHARVPSYARVLTYESARTWPCRREENPKAQWGGDGRGSRAGGALGTRLGTRLQRRAGTDVSSPCRLPDPDPRGCVVLTRPGEPGPIPPAAPTCSAAALRSRAGSTSRAGTLPFRASLASSPASRRGGRGPGRRSWWPRTRCRPDAPVQFPGPGPAVPQFPHLQL